METAAGRSALQVDRGAGASLHRRPAPQPGNSEGAWPRTEAPCTVRPVRPRLRLWSLAALFGLASLDVSFAEEAADQSLDEVLITGSHISGTGAAGSQLIIIDREQIDASGYGRIEDVLATVTQNFNRANA